MPTRVNSLNTKKQVLCSRVKIGIGNVLQHLFMMGGEHGRMNLGVVFIYIKYLPRECPHTLSKCSFFRLSSTVLVSGPLLQYGCRILVRFPVRD